MGTKKKATKASTPPAKPQWGVSPKQAAAKREGQPPAITKDSPIPSSQPLWMECEEKLLALVDERINEHKKALMAHHLKVQQGSL
mmetsp:Transcript_21698/g.60347  ORF Transcript_21698/g.60347 Transcript_21698/m.60347 type:complete len:85 (-) Transcript_21698:1058-1312(-)